MPPSQLPQAGELYGKYQLVEKIATGGMAEVFRAVSTSIGGFKKEVALKRILPHLSTDAEFVSLFIDEAKLTVSMSHGNIVQVFDFGRIDSNYYLAMEFVDGRDMTEVLIKQSRRRASVPPEVAFFIMKETLRGLEYAHTRRDTSSTPLGIVHRDVSPHNILISYDGEVKLTDFGIAKARTKVSLTRPGVVLGKFAYMSPEQAHGRDVDARSDVYSAGITLYETLTGRRLFYSEDPAQVLAKVRDPNVSPPSRYADGVSSQVDALVMTALAVRPEDRFPSCRAFGTALERELQTLAPEFNDAHLVRFMQNLFEDEVGADKFAMAAPARAATRGERPTVRIPPAVAIDARRPSSTSTDRDPPAGLDEPRLAALTERLRHTPDLWVLSQLGDTLLDFNRMAEAERVYRAAGLKFAQHGHLVQAVAHYVHIKELRGWNAALALEVEGIRTLPGESNATMLEAFDRADGPGEDELGELLRHVLTREEPDAGAVAMPSPLFSVLDSAEFANLVSLLSLRRIAPGTPIMREDESGDSLCILVRGRVLIYCRNFHGMKVYLSSLSDGDCFGEFSFFTGEPRTATVESLEDVLLFQIHQRDFDTILERFPNLTNALLRFYKSRVVNTLLAKSEVFGGLRPQERSWLLDRLHPQKRSAGETIIKEGEESDGFYLVKSGEVEVFSERKGYVFLSKLRSGEFFGEIAALTGHPRNASVRAVGPCELLRLPGEDLQALLRASPDVERILLHHIARREAETARRLTAGGALT